MSGPAHVLLLVDELRVCAPGGLLLDHALALKDQGLEVTILTSGGRLCREAEASGLTLMIRPLPAVSWRTTLAVRRLARRIRRRGVELIHAFGGAVAPLAAAMAHRIGCPLAVEVRSTADGAIAAEVGADVIFVSTEDLRTGLVTRRGVEKTRCRRLPPGVPGSLLADAGRDMSASPEASRVPAAEREEPAGSAPSADGAESESVGESAGDSPDGEPASSPRPAVIGCCGPLDRVERERILLDAVALGFTGPAPTVLVLGDGERRGEIWQHGLGLGLGESLLLALDQPRRRGLFALMDVYVDCAPDEVLSPDLLSAMAAGVPVITARSGGDRELLSEDGAEGLRVEPFAAGPLHEALGRLLALTSAQRGAMGAAARQRVLTRFPMDRRVETTRAVYRELLEGRGTRG